MKKVSDEQIRGAHSRYHYRGDAAAAVGLHVTTYMRRLRALGVVVQHKREQATFIQPKGRGVESRGKKKRLPSSSAKYVNICETLKCAGQPLSSGYCIRCTAEQRKADLAK